MQPEEGEFMLARQERFLGCILGGAIGDAMGSAWEGLSAGASPSERAWELTDDTQLTLATCEALSAGRVEAGEIAASLLRWYRQRRIRRAGSSTMKALRDLDAGGHWALIGRGGEYAAGNGAAMRIASLAFFLDPSLDADRVVLRDVCRLTHHHEEAYVGALAVVVAVRMAGFEGRLAGAEEVASRLPDSVVRDRLRQPLEEIGTSGYVGDTVPRAILMAARLPGVGFEGVLKQVLDDGGDTDTIGSIAGQIMGAFLGLGGLPGRLVDQLPERDLVLSIARSVLKEET